jgi:hypothetical protein
VAVDIVRIDLAPSGGDYLTDFAAGAYIDVLAPNGRLRQYSLIHAPQRREEFSIIVKLERCETGAPLELIIRTPIGLHPTTKRLTWIHLIFTVSNAISIIVVIRIGR